MGHESNNRKMIAHDDSNAALLALAQRRELHRVIIALLRVGEIKAVYEGPSDPDLRLEVHHYKFYKPHTEHQKDAALSPEALQAYRAYSDEMTTASLNMLCDAVERLWAAYEEVLLPEHECDVPDWPAVIEQIKAVDAASNHVLDVFQDEVLPNLESLRQYGHVRGKELATLESALEIVSAPPPSEG